MYEFKVWCPGLRARLDRVPVHHPGEKARRRDPRRFNYCGTACPEARKQRVPRGRYSLRRRRVLAPPEPVQDAAVQGWLAAPRCACLRTRRTS